MTLTRDQLAAASGSAAPTLAPHAGPISADRLYDLMMAGDSTNAVSPEEKKFWSDLAKGQAWAKSTLMNLLKLVKSRNDDYRRATAVRIRDREAGLKTDMVSASAAAGTLAAIDVAWLAVNFQEAYTRFGNLEVSTPLLITMSALVLPVASLLVMQDPVGRSVMRTLGKVSGVTIAVAVGVFLVSQANKIPLEDNREGFQLLLDMLSRSGSAATAAAPDAVPAVTAVPAADAVQGSQIDLDRVLGQQPAGAPSAALGPATGVFANATPEAIQSMLRIVSGYTLFASASLGISIATAFQVDKIVRIRELLYGGELPAGRESGVAKPEKSPWLRRSFSMAAIGGITYAALTYLMPEADMALKGGTGAIMALAYLIGDISGEANRRPNAEPLTYLREDLVNRSSETVMLRMAARVTQVLQSENMHTKADEFNKAVAELIAQSDVKAEDDTFARLASPKLAAEMDKAAKAGVASRREIEEGRLEVAKLGVATAEAQKAELTAALALAQATIAAADTLKKGAAAALDVAQARKAAADATAEALAAEAKAAALMPAANANIAGAGKPANPSVA